MNPSPEAVDVREKLAALCHEQWSGWMTYLWEKCSRTRDGALVIPKEYVDRWWRQMCTKYESLPEGEQNSDRKEADRFLAILAPLLSSPAEGEKALDAALERMKVDILGKAICVYCRKIGDKSGEAMMAHVQNCEKNPWTMLCKSLNVEKMLADVKASEARAEKAASGLKRAREALEEIQSRAGAYCLIPKESGLTDHACAGLGVCVTRLLAALRPEDSK